jgi:hypothetical protein
MVVVITVAVVITMIAVITMMAIMAELYLKAKSITLLLIICIPIIEIVCLIIYTNFVFLKESLRGYIVDA